MDKETEILSRLAANHLHLAQFEPLKATLLALRVRNPDLALTILQTIVSNAGIFENVLWSRSCPSPSLLAFLSTIELLRFENPTSPWGFDSETLSLRADFLLMVQVLIDRVTERIREGERAELESENGEVEEKSNEELDEIGGLRNCVLVLQGFMELGIERMNFDAGTSKRGGSYKIEEETIVSLRSIVLDYSDVFEALCCNIKRQLIGSKSYVEEGQGEEEEEEMEENGSPDQVNNNVFALIQKNVQLAQLDAMRKLLDEGDAIGAADRIRYLHLDYGVEKENYQYVLDLYSLQIHEVFELYLCDLFYSVFKSLSVLVDFIVFFVLFGKAGKLVDYILYIICFYSNAFYVPYIQ